MNWAIPWAVGVAGVIALCLWKSAIEFAAGVLAVCLLFALGALSEIFGFDRDKK